MCCRIKSIESPRRRLALPCASWTSQVVRKMAANIQPPDPERFKWEQHTTVVESPASPYPQGRLATSNGDGSNQIPGRCNSDTRAPCPKRGDLGAKDGATDDATGGNPRRSFWRAIAAAAAEDLTPLPSPASSAASLLEQARRHCRARG